MGTTGRKTRQPAEETRAALIAAALKRVENEGLTLDFANINLEDLIRSAGVPRSTVFRIWPDRYAFIQDLLRALFEFDGGMQTGFDDETLHIVERVVAENAELMKTADGRLQVLRSASRQAMPHNMAAVRNSLAWRTYKAVLGGVVGDRQPIDTNIVEMLREIELRFLARMNEVYAAFNALFHRRMIAGVNERDLASVLASMVEGLSERRFLLPEEVDRLRVTALDGDEPQPWPLAALGVYSVYVMFTEEIPDGEDA